MFHQSQIYLLLEVTMYTSYFCYSPSVPNIFNTDDTLTMFWLQKFHFTAINTHIQLCGYGTIAEHQITLTCMKPNLAGLQL